MTPAQILVADDDPTVQLQFCRQPKWSIWFSPLPKPMTLRLVNMMVQV
jgi:hypothetical protein